MPSKPIVDWEAAFENAEKERKELEVRNKTLSDTIGLDEFIIKDVQTDDSNMTITVVPRNPKPIVCDGIKTDGTLCGCRVFHKHQSYNRTFRHFNIDGRFVGVIVKANRYKCRDCRKTYTPQYKSVDAHSNTTRRLYDHIVSLLLTRTITDIAADYGMPFSTVQDIMAREFKALDAKYVAVAPRVLGIDEVHFRKNYYGTYVDVETARFIDISATRRGPDVTATIKAMAGYKDIEVVTMDMWRPYRMVIEQLLPSAIIVIDKYHVSRLINKALDKTRINIGSSLRAASSLLPTKKARRAEAKRIKALFGVRWHLLKDRSNLTGFEKIELDTVLADFPQLQEAYRLKEGFKHIFNKDRGITRAQAEKEYATWVMGIPSSKEFSHFHEPVETIKKWHPYIFNYFDARYTNAVTEAMNGELKYQVRQAKGLAFPNLRVKMLYAPVAKRASVYRPVSKVAAEPTSLTTKIITAADIGIALSPILTQSTITSIPHKFTGSPAWGQMLGSSLNDGYIHLRHTSVQDVIDLFTSGIVYES